MKKPAPPKKKYANADERRAAEDKRDAAIHAERKAQDVANQAKTERLRALRLAHEAALPKVEKAPKKARKAKR